MPALQQCLLMRLNQLLDGAYLSRAESPAPLQPDRVQLEFRLGRVPLDVDVGRFATIARVEEKAVGTDP
jgi:hypothetical protein